MQRRQQWQLKLLRERQLNQRAQQWQQQNGHLMQQQNGHLMQQQQQQQQQKQHCIACIVGASPVDIDSFGVWLR